MAENFIINYQKITFSDLKRVVKISKKDKDEKFNYWYSHKYEISKEENLFLEKLIKSNKLFLSGYNEAKLTFKFISPILNRVDFSQGDIQDWYENFLTGEVNGIKFTGKTDFMVAKGDFVPEKPYFFLQEFKRSTPANNPEFQVLAEMLVAMELNKTNIIYGSFVIGKIWDFIILEKLENGSYEYFTSKSLNCLDIDNLRKIYTMLQAAKALFCKE